MHQYILHDNGISLNEVISGLIWFLLGTSRDDDNVTVSQLINSHSVMHVSSSDESLIFQVQDNATTHFMVDVIHVDVLDDVLVNETTGYGTSN